MPAKTTIKKDAQAPITLIAGGAGFIGSNLAETLLLKESRVVVLDNFKTGKKNYVEHLLQNPGFALFDTDINNSIPEEIESVDYVIHLAGLEEYIYSDGRVNLDTLLTNSSGTRHLLELAHKSEAAFLLASSVDVYQGLLSPIKIKNYFGNTVKDERKYSLAEAKRFAEALVWEYFNKDNTNVRIVRLPEVYGPRMNLESGGNLGEYLNNLINGNDFTVYGDGVEKEYYLYITDAVAGIIKALFNKNTQGKIYTLIDDEPHATLELVYMLKNFANREVKINFKPTDENLFSGEPRIPEVSNLSDLNWEPKTPIKEGVKKTLKYLGYEINEHNFKPQKLVDDKKNLKNVDALNQIESITPQTDRPKANYTLSLHKTAHLPFLSLARTDKVVASLGIILLSFLLIFVGVPSLQTYLYTKRGVENLEKVPGYITQLDAVKSQESANQAFINFAKAQNSLSKIKWVAYITGKENLYESSIKLLGSVKQFSKAAYNISKAAIPFTSAWEVIRPNAQASFSEGAFDKSKLNLSGAKNSLQLAQAELKHVNLEDLPKKYVSKAKEYAYILNRVTTITEIGASLSTAIPELLGIDQPKKYLLLFQNPNEIRATGGFIGSYGLVELDKGKISNLSIDDIYNPDGQIDLRNISKTPPKPIKDFLKEDKLHIRNANWNPDFTQSAKVIDDLYSSVTGNNISGVIGLDLYLAKSLLKITGPVFLTAYNEEVTVDNLYEKTQLYSEFNYVEGSSQKRQFLTVLGSKLLEKVFSTPKEKMPSLFSELYTSLKEKHLMIYLENSTFGAALEKEGWDGSLIKTGGDYLYVVNSNLGGTKANYYVKNAMNYTVAAKTRDGLLRGELSLTYKHTGQSDAWPGGAYTNYVRVLTQSGSKLTGAKLIYSKADGTTQTTDLFDKMIISKEEPYNSFETSFRLEPKDTVELDIGYDLPANASINTDEKDYKLYWQKQPGTQDDAIKFKFIQPFGFKISQYNIKAQADYSGLTYQDVLNTDRNIILKLD